MKTLLLTIGIWMLGVSYSNAASCTAIGSGDWYDPSIWSCGIAPGCGDLVTIPAGITVKLDSHLMIDESSMPACNTPTYIQVFGTLQFVTGKKMELACGSAVEIMSGGLLQNGGGGGSSNWLKICGVTEWKSSDGDVPGYHLFGSPIPLPASLMSFETNNIGATVLVNWTLASERSVSYYRVDFSENGVEWFTVLNIPSRGDHAETVTYSGIVAAAPVSTGYFRLTSVDDDGTATELSLKSHQFVVSGTTTAFPNPVNQGSFVTIRTGTSQKSETFLEIIDMSGRSVETLTIPEESQSVTIETGNWDRGMYLIRFSDQQLQSIRLVVE